MSLLGESKSMTLTSADTPQQNPSHQDELHCHTLTSTRTIVIFMSTERGSSKKKLPIDSSENSSTEFIF